MKLYLDFETSSTADLAKVGVYRYADHPSTRVIALAYAIGDEDPTVLTYDNLHKFQYGSQYEFVAHNASFDRVIYRQFMTRYGWDSPKSWNCTMVRAYARGLPPSLEKLAQALGLQHQKDMANFYSMRRLSKTPDKISVESEIYQQLCEYAAQDIRVLQDVDQVLPELSPFERRVWQLDQKINDRGVLVDRRLVENAKLLNDSLSASALSEFRTLVHGYCESPLQGAEFTIWLKANGCEVPDLQADTLEKALETQDLPANCRRAIELRQVVSGAAVKKFDRMALQAGPRLQGQFQYHGAHTGRWAGRGVQVHNLARGGKRGSVLATLLASGDIDMFSFLSGGDFKDALKSTVRGALIPTPGRIFFFADYAGIENRVLAWLANEQHILDAYANGEDVYSITASTTFGFTVDKDKHPDERNVGKTQSLASGFQGGAMALHAMAKSLKIDVSMLSANGYRISTPDEVETARWVFSKIKPDIDEETFVGLDVLKQKWRAKHPNIVQLWYDVEEAIRSAIRNPEDVFELGALLFGMQNGSLICRLPSGRHLVYPGARLRLKEGKEEIRYMHEVHKKWVEVGSYGGKFVENIVQAIARDFLVEAMVRLDDRGYDIILHVHDEVGVEADPTDDFNAFLAVLSEPVTWAQDFRLSASGWKGYRYRK